MQVYAVISGYVEQFIDQIAPAQALIYEKPRSSDKDEKLKLSILSRFNKRRHHFAEEFASEEEFGLHCDLLLDLYRFRGVPVIIDA